MKPLLPFAVTAVLLAAGPLAAQDFSRWDKAIAAFERQDRDNPPPRDGILFVGSSSIRLWNLKQSFPGLPVINRGFGGSQLADSVHFAPQLILKHRPRVVVLYAGDNDLAAGKTPERVAADFKDFIRVVHKELPQTRIVYLSIKPSIARWKLVDRVRKANALIEAACKGKDGRTYLDVGTLLLGADGKPRPELFAKDGLHLSARGYQLWTDAVRPLLR